MHILKEKIKKEILKLACIFSRITKTNSNNFLIIAPARSGSLGDQALIHGAIAGGTLSDKNRIFTVLKMSKDDDWKLPKECKEIVLNNIFEEWINLPAWLSLVKHLRQYKGAWVIGADMMDGFYGDDVSISRLRLLNIASDSGLDARLLSFSFSKSASEKISLAIKNTNKSVKMLVRDPDSLERIIKLHPLAKRSADLAFFIKPKILTTNITNISEHITKERSNGKTLIGLNINQLVTRIEKTSNEEISLFIYNLLNKDDNYILILIAHDNRGDLSDDALLKAAYGNLSENHKSRTTFMKTPDFTCEVKAITSKLDLVITQRMHLGIASLGTATPTIIFDYADKAGGLLSLFNLRHLKANPRDINTPEFIDKITQTIKNKDEISNQIQSNLTKVKNLSMLNTR